MYGGRAKRGKKIYYCIMSVIEFLRLRFGPGPGPGCRRILRLVSGREKLFISQLQYSVNMAELLLDSNIRLWVFLPIVVITFLIGILRHYVTILLSSEKKIELQQIANRYIQQDVFTRITCFRGHGGIA
jgi:hypothetical protein